MSCPAEVLVIRILLFHLVPDWTRAPLVQVRCHRVIILAIVTTPLIVGIGNPTQGLGAVAPVVVVDVSRDGIWAGTLDVEELLATGSLDVQGHLGCEFSEGGAFGVAKGWKTGREVLGALQAVFVIVIQNQNLQWKILSSYICLLHLILAMVIENRIWLIFFSWTFPFILFNYVYFLPTSWNFLSAILTAKFIDHERRAGRKNICRFWGNPGIPHSQSFRSQLFLGSQW